MEGRRRRDPRDAARLRAAAKGRRAVRGRSRRPPAGRGDDRPGPPGAAERRRPRRLMADPLGELDVAREAVQLAAETAAAYLDELDTAPVRHPDSAAAVEGFAGALPED